jgi:hypothetical protein
MRIFDIAELPQSSVYIVDFLPDLNCGQLPRQDAAATVRIVLVFHSLMIKNKDITSMEEK